MNKMNRQYWVCCNYKRNHNFCPECGSKRPQNDPMWFISDWIDELTTKLNKHKNAGITMQKEIDSWGDIPNKGDMYYGNYRQYEGMINMHNRIKNQCEERIEILKKIIQQKYFQKYFGPIKITE
jgi:hypothetical protein